MEYELVTIESKKVIGKSLITSNENGKAVHDIGALWKTCMESDFFTQVKNQKTGQAIGLYTDYVGDASQPYRFMCCVEVSKIDEVLDDSEARTIAGGKYAKFTVQGDVLQAVGAAWQAIWAMDLKRKFTDDFEVYHNDGQDMTNQTIDIYIAVE